MPLFSYSFKLEVPIVGIGAAARYLLPEVANKLQTEVIFPSHFEVGNALGAIMNAQNSEWVIDLTETRKPIDKSTYYRIMGVTPIRSIRYDRRDFFALAAEHGYFGPFDKAYFFAEKSTGDPIKKNPGDIKL
jgi:hypothetical protein